MHPAMQRRRRQLLTRRGARRGSQRRGLLLAFVVVFSLFAVLIGGTVLGAGAGALFAYNYFASGLPDPNLLDDVPLPQSSLVYDRTGSVLLARFECQNRESVRFDEIPNIVVDATVASEDQTFWTNNGVDVQAVARAAYANLQAGSIVQGASTITQQVIKYAGSIVLTQEQADDSLVVPSIAQAIDEGATEPAPDEVCPPPRLTFLEGRGFEDKIREQIMAMQVTAAYPGREGKELILATYLNLIFYGNGSYGIQAAAANYFGLTDLSELTLAQAAFLAALPQRPSALDPYQNAGGPPGSAEAAADAMRERDGVLFRMLEEEYITLDQYNEATATSWEEMAPSRVVHPLLEPHFTFRVQREMVRILAAMGIPDPEQAVRIGGYRITTTLDYPLQQVAREQVRSWVARLADKNVHNGALVAIDSATGEIVTYIGSIDYYNQTDPRVQGQFDVAGLARRQPGSAFKPIVYTSAFRARQATVSTMFVDALTNFGNDQFKYEPTNADIREHGPVLAMDALRYSLNIPSVQMQWVAGGPEVTATFAESLGIASYDYIMAQDPGLSLGLGTVPVNLTNFTQAYSAFAQQGTLHPATAILEIRDREGEVIYTREGNGPETSNPMTPAEAYLTHWIIEGNTNPATNLLWGPRAQLFDPAGNRRHAGFKTGTTDDFKDVSGMGYIPGSLTVGVWMGNNNQEPMSNVLGQGLFSADGPLYLWHDFMDRAVNEPWDWNGHAAVPNQDFARPAGAVMAPVCRFSGMTPGGCGQTITVPFLEGTLPPRDNVHHADQWHPGGCFDIVQYVQQAGRPTNWVTAAAAWADKVNNGRQASSGSRYAVAPLYGNAGFGGPFCGPVKATPKPSPSPGCQGNGNGNQSCVPEPSPSPGSGLAPPAPGSTEVATLLPVFGLPLVLGAVPYLARLFRRRR
jgi:membrane peptidoglycan carboxypeptidase